jgi:hypothetical protein
MKTYNEFIRENIMSQKNYAPQGVIICSDKRAFLGMDHGKKPKLSDDLIAKLKDISKHGLWYEGDGGDIPYTEHLFGPKRNYSGGFDDNLLKSIKGHPPEFISALFSNDPPEKMAKHIVGNGTILEAMYAAGNQISSLKKAPRPTKETIKDFLKSISNPSRGLNFLEMADEKATMENAENFIKTVAKEMWPSNWESYPNPAGKVAKKANDNRDKWLASKSGRPNGVYVIGAGHLISISKFGGYKIIGGELIK